MSTMRIVADVVHAQRAARSIFACTGVRSRVAMHALRISRVLSGRSATLLMNAQTTPLLIVGAGPYGIGIGTYAHHRGIHPAIVGRPFELWRQMPPGMFLRSPVEWDFDP